MMRGTRVMWLCFVIVFCMFFITYFVVDLNILAARDLRMNFPNLPEVSQLEDLMIHGCICCACVVAIDTPLTMIVAAG